MKTSDSHPMWIAEIDLGGRKLGLSICPGKFQPNALSGAWNRSLDKDLDKIKKQGYDVVVSLIEDHEFKELRVTKLQEVTESFGMQWIWAPITDGGVPEGRAYEGLNSVVDLLESNQSVFVHCKGGLGRAGTVTAWALTHFERTSESAIREVRSARKGAIENWQQEEWVKRNSGLRMQTSRS